MEFITSQHDNHDEAFEDSINCDIAVPEKILICIDLCIENHLISQPNIQAALRIFVKSKLELNQAHSIALIGIDNDEFLVLSKLTNNLNTLLKSINAIPFKNAREELFDLSILHENLEKYIDVEKLEVIPEYIYRTIMLVNSSNEYKNHGFAIPSVCKNRFFFDVVLMDGEKDEISTPEETENNLTRLKELWKLRPSSFVFVINSLESIELKRTFVQLLAHPFQRPQQKMVLLDCSHIIEKVKAKQNT